MNKSLRDFTDTGWTFISESKDATLRKESIRFDKERARKIRQEYLLLARYSTIRFSPFFIRVKKVIGSFSIIIIALVYSYMQMDPVNYFFNKIQVKKICIFI